MGRYISRSVDGGRYDNLCILIFKNLARILILITDFMIFRKMIGRGNYRSLL